MAEIVRTEACEACHACRFGQQEKVYVDVGGLDCDVGDEVELEIGDGSFSKLSAIVYGIPIAFFLAALFAGRAFTSSEYVQCVCAFAGLALGLIVIKLVDRYINRCGRYAIGIKKCRRNGE